MILAVVLGEGFYNAGMLEQEYRRMPEYVREALAEQGYRVNEMSEDSLSMFYDLMIPSREEFYQEVLQDEEWQSDAVKNLGQALLFAVLGAVGVIVGQGKKEKTVPAQSETIAASVKPAAEFSRLDEGGSNDADAS